MRFPAYPKYKPSGVEWLGDIPQHWESFALRRRFRVVNGGTPSSAEDGFWDGDITWLTPDDLGKNDKIRIVNGRRQISKQGLDNCGASLVPKLSLIVSTRAPIGYVAINDVVAATNQGCRSLVSQDKNVSTEFFYYALIASKQILQAIGKGTTFMELSTGALGSHFVPLPALAEQRAIADFLDGETAKLDTLVAKKRALIVKLKEKRSELISRTVTRGLPPDAARAAGLNPNPKLKHSGIEWLGEIPEHWAKPRKLSLLASFRKHSFVNGPFGSDLLTSEITNEGVPVVYIRDISGARYRRKSESHVSYEKAKALDFCRVDPGDVLIAKVGDPPGSAAVYPDGEPSGIVTQDVIRIRVNDSLVCAEYLAFFLNSVPGHGLIDNIAIESTRMRVSLGDYKNSLCLLPRFSEQCAIANYLTHEVDKIDRMVAKVEEAIERLQEYRTALITAAVTGKIDVRVIRHSGENRNPGVEEGDGYRPPPV